MTLHVMTREVADMDRNTLNEILEDLKRNPWFGAAFEVYSYNQLREAGLRHPLTGEVKDSRDHPVRFYEHDNHPYVRFAASPNIAQMRQAAAEGSAVVLVAMGSYAPMHTGHIAMMEAADQAVRREGDVPIAAVFSMHCEHHVRAKILPTRPDAPLSTDTRMMQANAVRPEVLRTGTPTFLDTWDARMPDGPRSFTDIMIRIINTLEATEIRNVTPVAVFGSDNGVSMRAFSRWGRAVCVIRPGHDQEAERYIAEPQMKMALRERRVLITERDDRTVISSSDIREQMGARL